MRYTAIDPDFFCTNRHRLEKQLRPNSVAIVHSNDEIPRTGDQNFPFRQNSTLFYLSGLDQAGTIITLFPNHPDEAMREVAFITETDEHMVTWYGRKYTLKEAAEISGIRNIKWLSQFEATLRDFMYRAEFVYLDMEEQPKFSTEVESRNLRFARKLRNDYPLHQYQRLAPLVTHQRLVKAPAEMELINKAIDITGAAFRRVLSFMRPGIKEYEAEAEIIHEFIRSGATGHAFPAIVASGADNNILHYDVNNKVIEDGSLVLIDFGAEYANYASDCTRTIPANGRFTPRQRQVYESVLNVQRQAMKLMTPGNNIMNLQQQVVKLMEAELIKLGLITQQDVEAPKGSTPAYFKYYMHFVSHFMGLDTHDVGTRQETFRRGMVLTCEPGIYIAEEGFGIRLENDVMVDHDPVDLMAHIPVEPDEIEALMAKNNHKITNHV